MHLAPAFDQVRALDVYLVTDVLVRTSYCRTFIGVSSVKNTRFLACVGHGTWLGLLEQGLLNRGGKADSLASPGLQKLSTSARAAVLGVA